MKKVAARAVTREQLGEARQAAAQDRVARALGRRSRQRVDAPVALDGVEVHGDRDDEKGSICHSAQVVITTPAAAPIVYRVAMSDPQSHEYEIQLDVPALAGREAVDLVFPAWAPGSYLVRDFVRHVYRLTITDARGGELPATRLDKALARRDGRARLPRALTSYLAFEQSVRTSFLDDSHAYWNGTSLFFYVDGELMRHLPRRRRAIAALGLAHRHAAARRARRAQHLRGRRLRRARRFAL